MDLRIARRRDHVSRLKVSRREAKLFLLRWGFDVIRYHPIISKYCYASAVKKFKGYLYTTYTCSSRWQTVSKVRNLCRKTGRASGVSRTFRLSRHALFNELRQSQRFTGVTCFPFTKASVKNIKRLRCLLK